jgi:hypothetical protein
VEGRRICRRRWTQRELEVWKEGGTVGGDGPGGRGVKGGPDEHGRAGLEEQMQVQKSTLPGSGGEWLSAVSVRGVGLFGEEVA